MSYSRRFVKQQEHLKKKNLRRAEELDLVSTPEVLKPPEPVKRTGQQVKAKPMGDPYVKTLSEIAKQLSLTKRTLQRHIKDERILVEKFNRIVHCRESEIVRFLKKYDPSRLENKNK